MNNGKNVHGILSDISSVSLVVLRGAWTWDREVRYDAAVVARPDTAYRLVEDRSQAVRSNVGP